MVVFPVHSITLERVHVSSIQFFFRFPFTTLMVNCGLRVYTVPSNELNFVCAEPKQAGVCRRELISLRSVGYSNYWVGDCYFDPPRSGN